MGNWSPTVENAKMPACRVGVKQSPEGMILGVKFIKCSGTDAAYRASIQNAIYMAEPLPKPKDPTIFDPDLKLIFTSWE